jgi:hypothetical protein
MFHKLALYDVTDSSWVSVRFKSWLFRFYFLFLLNLFFDPEDVGGMFL